MSTTDEKINDKEETTFDTIYNDFKQRKTLLTIGAVVGFILVFGGYIDVPDWSRDVVISVAVGGTIGYLAAGKVWGWIKQPVDYMQIIEVDAATETFRQWFVPPEWWERRKNKADGSPYLYDGDKYGVRDLIVDQEQERIIINKGLWKSEATDLELETHKQAVYETRGRMRSWARRGRILYLRMGSIAESIASRYWQAMADKDMQKKQEFPEKIKSELDEELGNIRDELDPKNKDQIEQLVSEIQRDHGDINLDDWNISDKEETENNKTVMRTGINNTKEKTENNTDSVLRKGINNNDTE